MSDLAGLAALVAELFALVLHVHLLRVAWRRRRNRP